MLSEELELTGECERAGFSQKSQRGVISPALEMISVQNGMGPHYCVCSRRERVTTHRFQATSKPLPPVARATISRKTCDLVG